MKSLKISFRSLLRSRYSVVFLISLGIVAILYIFSLIQYSQSCLVPRANCLQLRKAGCSISGVYRILPGTAQSPVEAYCDMQTDQGGWTLVANYLHRGSAQSKDTVLALKDRFPIPTGHDLGSEAKGKAWGHASNDLLNRLDFHELRFHCQSSSHTRTLDFAVSSSLCLDYFRTGKGTCASTPEARALLSKAWRPLAEHTAKLPGSTEKGWQDQGDNAIVYYPFFVDWKNHWSTGASANRWECDDSEIGGQNNTFHQVYIR